MKEENQKKKILSIGFLRKQLDARDSEAFRNSLQEDDVQEQVSEEVVHQYGRQQLKSRLEDIHQTLAIEKKRRRTFLIYITVALLALLSYLGWRLSLGPVNHSIPAPTEIFATYFNAYPSVFDQKGGTASEEQELMSAMGAYAAQDYPRAIQLFETQLNQNLPKHSLHSFYYSIALLADQQVDKAIGELEALLKSPKALLPQGPLHWYLALAYLGEGNAAAAQPILQKLAAAKQNIFKQQEAAEILKLL